MESIKYKIEFLTYWHIGSGITGGTYADNLVLKDENGLPFIPGKTLKGLFREAAEEIQWLDSEWVGPDVVNQVFGKREGTGLEDEARLFFSNAVLSKQLAENIIKKNGKAALYEVISSTQLDKNGLADDGSLRQLEVCVPLTLFGSVEVFEEVEKDIFRISASWIKSLGLNRNRGLGKCKISIL